MQRCARREALTDINRVVSALDLVVTALDLAAAQKLLGPTHINELK